MKKLLLICYYAAFWRIPMQPFPGFQIGYKVRGLVVKCLLRHCGKGIVVKNRCYFGNGSRLSVGNNSQLGQNSRLQGTIFIGDDCVMGPDVVIMATSHGYDRTDIPIRLQGGWEKPIRIGNDVWIGTRVIILPGVELGNHCIVAAGAVVTKSFPPYSIIGGVPARLLKSRLQQSET